MSEKLQHAMVEAFKNKTIFEQASQYAFEYADQALERRVYPSAEAIARLSNFVETLPDSPSEAGSVLEQLHRFGSPATTAQIGGRYFGFVNGGVIPTALAARWLADFWDQNAALHVMSPVTATLEAVTEQWLRHLLGLPEQVVAGFVSGTSMSILCGLAAARYRLLHNLGWDVNRNGLSGAPKIRIVTGQLAHATVLKAVALLGFGTDCIEWVETDAQGRIIPTAVPTLDQQTILVLQAGNVNSGSFDAFAELCQAAQAAQAWVHVDGAFGLWAAACERLSHLTNGIAQANSWSVDGHKTLNTPYDSGIILCADAEALAQALQASGSYIAYSDQRDGMRYTPEMSRRGRATELWATLKYLGRSGVDDLIFGLHERAVQFAHELQAHGFNVLNEVVFNQTLVDCGDEALTAQTLQQIQQSGECWVGGSTWNGKVVIRISVCSWATTADDVSRSVRAFVAAREVASKELRTSRSLE